MRVRDIIKVSDYVVVYGESQTGWAAYVPDLPGVVTSGRRKTKFVRSLTKRLSFTSMACEKASFRFTVASQC